MSTSCDRHTYPHLDCVDCAARAMDFTQPVVVKFRHDTFDTCDCPAPIGEDCTLDSLQCRRRAWKLRQHPHDNQHGY